jgi:hypothetical protein
LEARLLSGYVAYDPEYGALGKDLAFADDGSHRCILYLKANLDDLEWVSEDNLAGASRATGQALGVDRSPALGKARGAHPLPLLQAPALCRHPVFADYWQDGLTAWLGAVGFDRV